MERKEECEESILLKPLSSGGDFLGEKKFKIFFQSSFFSLFFFCFMFSVSGCLCFTVLS